MHLSNGINLFEYSVELPTELFKHTVDECKKFSNKLSSRGQSFEHYRNERAATKPSRDAVLGKMGELYAAMFLHRVLGYPLIEPDFAVYKARNKDWSYDLQYPTGFHSFHVKSCDSLTKRMVGDQSWTFQYNNGTDRLFRGNVNDNKELILFVYVDDIYKSGGEVVLS